MAIVPGRAWDKAQELYRRIQALEAEGDRTDTRLLEAQAELRRLLGLPTPRVERRSKTRLDQRRPGRMERRSRPRGPDRRAAPVQSAKARALRRNPPFQRRITTALADRIHHEMELRRRPVIGRRRIESTPAKIRRTVEKAGVAGMFWRRI